MKIRKMISLLCVGAMLLSSSVSAQATPNEPIAELDIQITYALDGTSVIEDMSYANGDGTRTYVTRAVAPDGTLAMEITAYGETTEYTESGVDYDMFYQFYCAQNQPMLMADWGTDLTGSQYIHQYIGSPGTINYTKADLQRLKTEADILASILDNFAGLPGKLMAKLVDMMADSIITKSCQSMKVTTLTYQVLFAVDNSYYIHCYHEEVKCYSKDNFKGTVETSHGYYQVIGG